MIDPNENQIECTRCGASVYYELTVCPECGLNFYAPEQDEWQQAWTADTETGSGAIRGISIVAILLGSLSAGLTLFLAQWIGRALISATQPLWMNVLFGVSGALAGFVGGLLASWLSEDRHLTAAISVGVLSILLSILFEAVWRDLDAESWLTFRVVLTWIVILAAAWGGGMWARNRALRVDDVIFNNDDDLYHDLVVKVSYDRALAERLIAYERQRAPNATQAFWIRSAIIRWERDNRI